jgi:hypothetical protein
MYDSHEEAKKVIERLPEGARKYYRIISYRDISSKKLRWIVTPKGYL